jgi:hypothetical protein
MALVVVLSGQALLGDLGAVPVRTQSSRHPLGVVGVEEDAAHERDVSATSLAGERVSLLAVTTSGLHLERTDENVDEIAALAGLLGGAAGLDEVLDNLKYRARRAVVPRRIGRAVSRAYAFDRYDQRDESWWPQGITNSSEASDPEVIALDRNVVVLTWYSKAKMGSRVTFLDLDTLRYRHVLLVEPILGKDKRLRLEPVRIHAGGIVWCGPYLHIAATSRGFVTCRVDDIMRVDNDNEVPEKFGILDNGRVASYGHHFVLPVRFRYKAVSHDKREQLRYSFLSLDRSAEPPVIVAGEYGRGRQSTRLARFHLDASTRLLETGEDGFSRPIAIDESGIRQMQGAVLVGGQYYVSVSRGPWAPGSMFVGSGTRMREHLFATPMGPEDLSYWPETDTLWSVSEHPRRRWVYAMKRRRLERQRWLDKQGWVRDLPLHLERSWKRLIKGRFGRRG